jgi:hypothetical protein
MSNTTSARLCRWRKIQPDEIPKLEWLHCHAGAPTWRRGRTRSRLFTATRARHLAHKLHAMPAYIAK